MIIHYHIAVSGCNDRRVILLPHVSGHGISPGCIHFKLTCLFFTQILATNGVGVSCSEVLLHQVVINVYPIIIRVDLFPILKQIPIGILVRL